MVPNSATNLAKDIESSNLKKAKPSTLVGEDSPLFKAGLKNQEGKPSISPLWKGEIPYRESLALQEQLKSLAYKTKQAFLLGFECPATITLGLRGQKDIDLKQTESEYAKQGIEIVPIKRGGQATLHSKGQLVLYPIMDLLQWKIRPRDFLSLLEEVTKKTGQHYGVKLDKKEDFAGLFTQKGKVAFFGIHISQGVSQHGLSLSVKNDLTLFNLISSCGVAHRPHDSLYNQGVRSPLKEIFNTWCNIATPLLLQKQKIK